nr:MAG TPA: hypothetical protein [Bacteriophage sp.]
MLALYQSGFLLSSIFFIFFVFSELTGLTHIHYHFKYPPLVCYDCP